jgi:hypothetical protein
MLPITTVPITTGYGSAAASVLGESQLLPTDTRWRTQQPIIEEPEDLYISEGGSDIPMDHLDRLDHASPSASQLDQHTYISSVLPESQLDPLATNNNIYRSRW